MGSNQLNNSWGFNITNHTSVLRALITTNIGICGKGFLAHELQTINFHFLFCLKVEFMLGLHLRLCGLTMASSSWPENGLRFCEKKNGLAGV